MAWAAATVAEEDEQDAGGDGSRSRGAETGLTVALLAALGTAGYYFALGAPACATGVLGLGCA